MLRFILQRLAGALLSLATVAAMVFVFQVDVLYRILHVSPAAALLYPHDTARAIAKLNQAMGLNQPISVQFVDWIQQTFLHGGLARDVASLLPPTAELLGMSVVLAFFLATGLARLEIRLAGTFWERAPEGLMSLMAVIPGFWLGVFLLYFFSIHLFWFPGNAITLPQHSIFDWFYHEILPVATLALTIVGPWERTLKASLEEATHTDYVRTARAKGVRESRIRSRHMLRNSVLPLITLVGLTLPTALNTLIVVELIYRVPGIGEGLYNELTGLFFSRATTIVLVLALITIVASVMVDLAYGLVDPRIKYR